MSRKNQRMSDVGACIIACPTVRSFHQIQLQCAQSVKGISESFGDYSRHEISGLQTFYRTAWVFSTYSARPLDKQLKFQLSQIALLSEQSGMVEFLVEVGADINIADTYGE